MTKKYFVVLVLVFGFAAMGCAGGSGSGGGGILDGPGAATQQVSLVFTPNPDYKSTFSCTACGCFVDWTWQTSTAADAGVANNETTITLGLLDVGTPLNVEGDVTCCNYPYASPTHQGTIEILADGNLVAINSCSTPDVPQLGCVSCSASASYTIP